MCCFLQPNQAFPRCLDEGSLTPWESVSKWGEIPLHWYLSGWTIQSGRERGKKQSDICQQCDETTANLNRASLFRSSGELECSAVGGPLHCRWQSMNQFNLAFDTSLPHLRMCPKQLMRHVGMIHALRMCMESNLGNVWKHLHGPVKNLRAWGNARNTEFLKSSRKERQ